MDKSKRMSVCSNEVCQLSEKKSGTKTMASLLEDPNRASPIPFNKDNVVKEAFAATAQETHRQSQNIESSEEGNVHITRKTKVEESFVRSQKMYTAEVNASSQSLVQVRGSSPEMEQIMAKRQISQTYQDSSRLTPNTLSLRQIGKASERCLTPEIEHLMDKPHGTWSPMPPACLVRPISPNHIISYPPDLPQVPISLPQPRTATPEQFQEARETVERFVDHTKQVHQTQTQSTGRSTQSYMQSGQNISVFSSNNFQQSSVPQYTPRYDTSQGFSAYNGQKNLENSDNHGNPGNHNTENPNIRNNKNSNNENGISRNHAENNQNPDSSVNGSFKNTGTGNSRNGNGAPGNSGNSNPSDEQEDEPKVTEPDESEEKFSRKSSKTDQSQKSSRKGSSVTEEETSRRVFTDFGGPQTMSSVEVESTTEGGIQTTSVKKSEKTEYSSCEFESSRKSSVKQNEGSENGSGKKTSMGANGESKSDQSKTFSGETSRDEEEMMTKSQVEEIIKQELNKVFQMAQTMEKTNFGEMYDYRAHQASAGASSKCSTEQKTTHVESQKFEQKSISSLHDRAPCKGEIITKTGKLTSGLTIAPERPFTPQALESNYPLTYQNIPSDSPLARSHPEPPPAKPAYIEVTGGRDSPFLHALTIASDRPYSPLPTATSVETAPFITQPKSKMSSMVEALTTAPSTPYHVQGVSSDGTAKELKTSEASCESIQKYAPKPTQGNFKPISSPIKPPSNYTCKTQIVESKSIKSFPPVSDELKSNFRSSSTVKSSVFAESEKQQTETSKQTSTASHERSLSASRTERPMTPSGLHAPNLLPYYQQNIGEIPLAHRSNSPVPRQIKAPTITSPRPESVTRQGERRSSVKALSEAYTQQLASQNNQQASVGTSSVTYTSSGAFSSGSVTRAYSYEQEHKSIDTMGYQASPLAGKLPLAGEHTLPKCSSPVMGKLGNTKQVFKPSIPAQQPISAFQSPIAEQANLKQAPPYFVLEKDKPQAPWVVFKEKDEGSVNISLPKPSLPTTFASSLPQSTTKPSLPTFPSVSKTLPSFPEIPKPPSMPGVSKFPSALPDAGPGKGGSTAGTTAPRRGRGVLNTGVSAGGRIPLCGSCNSQIRGPFITALGKIWCPEHFVCVNAQCHRPLQDIGFVEDAQGLYCEYCFEQYLAPTCNKCNAKVKGDCLNAIGKHFHPECFTCAYCGKLFGNSPFFLEDALPYCETDWNELFTTKCFSCGFPIEAGDRWVEALNNNYHSQCFNCTMCKKNLEGQSFFAKGGRPFCKNHAR